ncbi:MAG: hypothetical protein ACYCV5_14100 [Acidimicrobiales bacterium]
MSEPTTPSVCRVVELARGEPIEHDAKVATWFSAVAPHGVRHLSPACTGLENSASVGSEISTWGAVCADMVHRPCRMCALETALVSVLKGDGGCATVRGRSRRAFVTLSSQAAPLDPGTKLHAYRWHTSTPSGEARLAAVAEAVGLRTGRATCGLVAWGFIPRQAVAVLERNLRVLVVRAVHRMPQELTVLTYWSLENDAPVLTKTNEIDPWEAAVAVSGDWDLARPSAGCRPARVHVGA